MLTRFLAIIAAFALAACASAPAEPEAPSFPQIKVIDHDCQGARLYRMLIDISPGNQPNQALVTVAPTVCADAI